MHIKKRPFQNGHFIIIFGGGEPPPAKRKTIVIKNFRLIGLAGQVKLRQRLFQKALTIL